MNQQDNGQLRAPAPSQDGTAKPGPAGFGDAPRFTVDKKSAKKNEAVLGPFTVRDLTVFGSTLLLFIASLIPMFAFTYNLWNLGSLFFLGLGVALPLIVTALFVARRLSPGTRIRIGSLSIDQFASVVASFALGFYFLAAAEAFVPSMLIAVLGAAGLFAATVLARWIPVFAGDFLGREESPAHVVAREAVVPVQKPRAPKKPKEPKPAKDVAAAGAAAAAASGPAAGWGKRPAAGGPTAAAASPAAPVTGGQAGAAAAAASGADSTAPATQLSDAVPAAGPGSPAPSDGSAPAPSSASAPSAATAPAAGAPSAAEQTHAAGDQTAGAAAGAAAATAAASAHSAPTAAEQTQAAELPASSGGSAPTAVHPQVQRQEEVRPQEPIGATVDPASRPAEDQGHPVHEAFWFAVAQPRTAVDERTGAPAFVIEPGGWVLALEDRGNEFLVQHTDGRLGVLRDLSNIERG